MAFCLFVYINQFPKIYTVYKRLSNNGTTTAIVSLKAQQHQIQFPAAIVYGLQIDTITLSREEDDDDNIPWN